MYPQPQQPNQFKGKGALDAFFNLLSLVTVGWLSIALGMILFQLINKFFVSKAVDYVAYFDQGALKFGIASVFILTPVFLTVSAWLHHYYKQDRLDHKSGVHRWLTYLMLFVSALVIIGRLIYQLFRFLDGDYAIAVILKTLVIFAIAGGIFGYYIYDLIRKDFSKRSIVSLVVFILVIVVTLTAVVGGFFVIDSPQVAQAKKYDQQRVDDLYNLSSMITDYYQQNEKLPDDLSAEKFARLKDPQTDQVYEYKVLGEKEYELCATFSLAVDLNDREYYYGGNKDWSFYKEGYQCFSTRVNEDEFKVVPAPVERVED